MASRCRFVSLVLLGLWAFHFHKIGVAFMPALDEGTTLDMPITVPRASVTQSADDLKARDALLARVSGSRIGHRQGRPGRHADRSRPARHGRDVRQFPAQGTLAQAGAQVRRCPAADRASAGGAGRARLRAIAATHEDDRDSLINDATQKALERFDETMRELALLRYQEVRARAWSRILTRFAVAETIRRIDELAICTGLAGVEPKQQEIDRLTAQFTPDYGVWLAKYPALEDVTQLSRARCQCSLNRCRRRRRRGDGAGTVKESLLGRSGCAAGEVARRPSARPSPAKLLAASNTSGWHLWHERVKQINWELFDRGIEALHLVCPGRSGQSAASGRHWWPTLPARRANRGVSPRPRSTCSLASRTTQAAFAPFSRLREELAKAVCQQGVFLWPRQTGPKGDLVDDEMGRVLQVPGWSNIFTQPIINRIEMLSTGVRTDIGVKVFGADLDTIDRVCKDIEAALKPINGARDAIAVADHGQRLSADRHRPRKRRPAMASRVEDIQNEIEVALAGRAVTYTVEKRDRFPVRIRYARVSAKTKKASAAC